jgi:putative flippase GtrA
MIEKLRNAQPLQEFVRYFAASGVALALDVGAMLLAAQVMHYLLATSLGFIIGSVASYALASRWVFRTRKLADRQKTEFAAYFLVGLCGLVINDLAVYLAVERAALALIEGKIIAAGLTFFFNYAIRKFALFR